MLTLRQDFKIVLSHKPIYPINRCKTDKIWPHPIMGYLVSTDTTLKIQKLRFSIVAFSLVYLLTRYAASHGLAVAGGI